MKRSQELLTAMFFILPGVAAVAQGPLSVEPDAPAYQPKAAVKHEPKTVLEWGYLYNSNGDFLSRENISTAEMAPISLLHMGLDDVTENSAPILKVGVSFGAAIFDRAVLKTGHEYGHFSSWSRLGYSDWWYGGSAFDIERRSSPLRIFNEDFPNGHVFSGVSDGELADIDRHFGRSRQFYESYAAFDAGGLNQNQATLVRYRDRLLNENFGLYDTVPYFGLTLSTFLYPSESGDLSSYSDDLNHYGIHTSEVSVRLVSLVRFASGSSWSAFGSYIAGVRDGNKADLFQPLKIDGWSSHSYAVYWPEFESWLSRRGPTVKVVLPLHRANGEWFMPSFEQSLASGGMVAEAGGSLATPIGQSRVWTAKLSAFANTEGGVWLEPGVGIRAYDWLFFDLGGYCGNGYTFHRDIYGATYDFVDRTEFGVKAGFTVFLSF